jgi:hypothetical protein
MSGRTFPAIYLCGGDDRLVIPDPDCPNSDLHTPQPSGYVDWFEWAARMTYKGNTQSRCPGCGLLSIWSGGRP